MNIPYQNTPFDETLASIGEKKLRLLCGMIGFGQTERAIVSLFHLLTNSWGTRGSALGPSWKSDLSDDHTPFEFSIAFSADNTCVLRILAEAQGCPANLDSNWRAGLALNQQLQEVYGASLERFNAVRQLFSPQWDGARFALWHAACSTITGPPTFKLYLNPASRGPQAAPSIVKEAFRRVGFDSAWPFLEDILDRDNRNHLAYFSLDLLDTESARIKVYIGHRSATATDIDNLLSTCDAKIYQRGIVPTLCRSWVGHEGPFDRRPPLTCYAFTSTNTAAPDSVTFHFPIRSYVENDAIALNAILEVLPSQHRQAYQTTISKFAGRQLSDGVGLQTYVSVRGQGRKRCTTVYLATEIYAIEPARSLSLPDQNTSCMAA